MIGPGSFLLFSRLGSLSGRGRTGTILVPLRKKLHRHAGIPHQQVLRELPKDHEDVEIPCGPGNVDYLEEINNPKPSIGDEKIERQEENPQKDDGGKGNDAVRLFPKKAVLPV